MIDTWHLIGYLTWHILYCVLSILLFIYFMHVTSYPVYFYSSIIVYVHTIFAIAPSLFNLHTHWIAFWRPWICTFRYWIFYCIDQVFDEIGHVVDSWSFPLSILVFLPSFIPVVSFDSCISDLASIVFLISCIIMGGHLYVVLQWSWFIIV